MGVGGEGRLGTVVRYLRSVRGTKRGYGAALCGARPVDDRARTTPQYRTIQSAYCFLFYHLAMLMLPELLAIKLDRYIS